MSDLRTNQILSIVMIERGARWSWSALGHAGEDWLMLAQQADESALAFADRVAHRVAEARKSGGSLRHAVLATGDEGRDSFESRQRIRRTLATNWPFARLDVIDEPAPDSRAA